MWHSPCSNKTIPGSPALIIVCVGIDIEYTEAVTRVKTNEIRFIDLYLLETLSRANYVPLFVLHYALYSIDI